MERPIIIWLKDNGKITKEMLEEVAKKAYQQGYEDGMHAPWYTYGYNTITSTNPKDIRVELSEVDYTTGSTDCLPPYFG